jgi:hypothetical protein
MEHEYVGGEPKIGKAGFCKTHDTWEKIENGKLYIWKKGKSWIEFRG